MKEFELIDHFFKSHAQVRADVRLGIGDDCALVEVPAGQWLAVSTDTLVKEVHFDQNVPPLSLGHKALAASLSDLAAMGAEPAWVMLSLTLPEIDEKWCADFSQGFFSLLERYHLSLIGGNTSYGPLNITTQVFGFVPPHIAPRRDAAKVGDLIYVTGTLGDAGLALAWRQGRLKLSTHSQNEAIKKLDEPEPRIKAGLALRGLANAMIDLSDGLIIDLGHILQASSVGATVYMHQLPLSSALVTSSLHQSEQWEMALAAGNDYELCFTISPEKEQKLMDLSQKVDCQLTLIGVIEQGSALQCLDQTGKPFIPLGKGYEHFS